jgi:hypothetical protein
LMRCSFSSTHLWNAKVTVFFIIRLITLSLVQVLRASCARSALPSTARLFQRSVVLDSDLSRRREGAGGKEGSNVGGANVGGRGRGRVSE